MVYSYTHTRYRNDMSAEAATEPQAAAPVEETKAPATAAVEEPSSGTGEKRKADDEPEGQPNTKCVYPTRITIA